MSWLKGFWDWLCCNDPPPRVRSPEQEYQQKWAELPRAYKRSEFDRVRELTSECRDLKREMDGL